MSRKKSDGELGQSTMFSGFVDSLTPPIDDGETLHRRIGPMHLRDDGSPTSAAFNDDNMSVDRASFRTTEQSLTGYQGFGLRKFGVVFAKDLQQRVEKCPELTNPAHAEVVGKKSKSIARRFAKESAWSVEPARKESTGTTEATLSEVAPSDAPPPSGR